MQGDRAFFYARDLLAWIVLGHETCMGSPLASSVPVGKPRLARYDIGVNLRSRAPASPVNSFAYTLSY